MFVNGLSSDFSSTGKTGTALALVITRFANCECIHGDNVRKLAGFGDCESKWI
jgi:hypothetical protein